MATELEQEESDQNLVQKYLHALLRPLMDKGGVRSPWWGRGIPGVGFYADMGKIGIVRVEMDNPYQDMVLYDLQEVDLRPMNILDIPPEAKPYPGCLQDILLEEDEDDRFNRLEEFFKVFGMSGDPSESMGLLYQLMQLWNMFYSAVILPPDPQLVATLSFFVEAGIVGSLMKLLGKCSNKKFLLMEYNRHVPFRALETMFAVSQLQHEDAEELKEDVVRDAVEDAEKAYDIFYALVCGQLSCLEEVMACQLVANFSCHDEGLIWLTSYPKLVGKVGMHLWTTYDVLVANMRQYEHLTVPYVRCLASDEIEVLGGERYSLDIFSMAELCTSTVMSGLSNVCAVKSDDEDCGGQVEPCLLEVVKEGLFSHLGTVTYGVLLNDGKHCEELTVEKFLGILSRACSYVKIQRLAVDQLNSLPTHRGDSPLFYDKDSWSKSRSVIACLVTHACHFDYEKGSHFAMLALIHLLEQDDEVAMEVVRVAGDTLFDMAHSLQLVDVPDADRKPVPLKRTILETILKFSGCNYLSEAGELVKASSKRFKRPFPSCVKEARSFCELYSRQVKMDKNQLEKMVRCADDFKTEGNRFFGKRNFHSAIECYTRALTICPLTCTERRVTYYSNRAECYLKTDQSLRAVRDCNKALAQNHHHLTTRWRRAQALQNIHKHFPAALDLITIRRHKEEAKKILGDRHYDDLDQTISDLMDGGQFRSMAEKKCGPRVYCGSKSPSDESDWDGRAALNMDKKENRLKLPPYKGRYYQELFTDRPGNYRV